MAMTDEQRAAKKSSGTDTADRRKVPKSRLNPAHAQFIARSVARKGEIIHRALESTDLTPQAWRSAVANSKLLSLQNLLSDSHLAPGVG